MYGTKSSWLLIFSIVLFSVVQYGTSANKEDIHGGVPMGVINNKCDNASWNLQLDWDDSNDYEYACQNDEDLMPPNFKAQNVIECQPKDKQPMPIHYCMNTSIIYKDQPPRAGPHRPLWPVYGEYLYIPPQRWVHGLEHGGVAFLYHPCADPDQVDIFRTVASRCIRRRVFTPYRNLTRDHPFAVVTYGCRLRLGWIDVERIVDYIRTHAINPYYATETQAYQDGQYSKGLIQKSNIASDLYDSDLCPDENFADFWQDDRQTDKLHDIDEDNLMNILQELGEGMPY